MIFFIVRGWGMYFMLVMEISKEKIAVGFNKYWG